MRKTPEISPMWLRGWFGLTSPRVLPTLPARVTLHRARTDLSRTLPKTDPHRAFSTPVR